MKIFWVLVKLRTQEVLRKPSTAVLFFALPPLLLAVTGLVFRDGHPFEKRRIAVVGKPCLELAGPDALVQSVDSLEAGKAALQTHVVNAVVDCEEVYVEARDERFGRALSGGGKGNVTVLAGDRFGYVRYIFAGLTAYVMLLSGLFGMGYTMVRYRQARFLKKLATTPLSPWVFVLSQISARSLLVLGQLLIMLLAAQVMDVRVHPAFLAVALLGLWTAMAIGFAIASFVHNAEVMGDAINAAGIPLVFLSEVFFPLDVLPQSIATLAAVLPSTLLVRGLRTFDPSALMGLGAWAVACSLIALLTFRWER